MFQQSKKTQSVAYASECEPKYTTSPRSIGSPYGQGCNPLWCSIDVETLHQALLAMHGPFSCPNFPQRILTHPKVSYTRSRGHVGSFLALFNYLNGVVIDQLYPSLYIKYHHHLMCPASSHQLVLVEVHLHLDKSNATCKNT